MSYVLSFVFKQPSQDLTCCPRLFGMVGPAVRTGYFRPLRCRKAAQALDNGAPLHLQKREDGQRIVFIPLGRKGVRIHKTRDVPLFHVAYVPQNLSYRERARIDLEVQDAFWEVCHELEQIGAIIGHQKESVLHLIGTDRLLFGTEQCRGISRSEWTNVDDLLDDSNLHSILGRPS